jgi:adiponectin receptor
MGVFTTIFLGIHLHTSFPTLFIEPVYIFLICAFACFTTSSIYHIFIPVSRYYFPFFISLDYVGVTLMIAGSSLPHTIYAHMCRPYLAASYITLISATTLITIFITLNPIFRTEAWAKARVSLFILLGIVCLIPLLHMILVSDNTPAFRTISKLIWTVVGSNLLGAFFYASRFPESFAPGRYDFFNSHTIMHIFILIAAATMYYSCTIHLRSHTIC